MVSLGVIFVPYWEPEQLLPVARAADAAGLEELWLWEDCFREAGISSAAAVLASTERLRVEIGLMPVPLRNVSVAAMELATMERMFPQRLIAGFGHGVLELMTQVGAGVESPMTLLREYVSALRTLLHGERVTTAGRYVRLDSIALDWPPSSPPPVLVGAIGPRTLRLAGEIADGTIITAGTSSKDVRERRELIEDGRRVGSRDIDHRVVVFLHAAAGPDAGERMEAERVRWGYESIDGLAAVGDAAAVAAAVQDRVDAGADTVVLQPTPDDPDPERFIELAGEVAALLR